MTVSTFSGDDRASGGGHGTNWSDMTETSALLSIRICIGCPLR